MMSHLAATVLRACYTYGTPRHDSAPRVLHLWHASPRQCSARVTLMVRLAATVLRACYTYGTPRHGSAPRVLHVCHASPRQCSARVT
eukprot:294803-Prorocentrum_minimum.AAC.2